MIVQLQKQTAPLITRFAPSPTGYLHLGHIVSMAFVYGIAKAAKATVLLRIEDHDRGRCRPEYEQAIFDDLKWLGFNFDDQPRSGVTHPLRQSDRTGRFQELADQLISRDEAYPCICTRAQIQQRTKVQKMNEGDSVAEDLFEELFYDGACRNVPQPGPARDFGLRVRVPNRDFAFKDGILGVHAQNPHLQCGDFLIKDRHGNFTYQFAATVDDMDQNINLVVRGSDILHATGRQIYLAETLGRKTSAQYVHHPLLKDEDGKKLSKRFFSEAVAKKRGEGMRPEQLLAAALVQAGLLDDQAKTPAIMPSELAGLFEIRMMP